jgi:PAS domain-containing protein
MENQTGQHKAIPIPVFAHKSAKNQIQSLSRKMQWIADAIPGGAVILNENFEIDYISPDYYTRLGYSELTINWVTPPQLLVILFGENWEKTFDALYTAARFKNNQADLAYKVRNKSGDWITSQDLVKLKYDEYGKFSCGIITNRKILFPEQLQQNLPDGINLLQKIAG